MARVPRWAEKLFSARCSWGDAVATKPDEDINGWDYFVEFADRTTGELTERSPSRRQAFAQIKSTTGNSCRTKIKLSNVLKACDPREAWFVFLVKTDQTIYGREIIDDVLSRGLREVRKARLEGTPLHKTTMSLDFRAEDKIDGDLVEWMQARLGDTAQSYTNNKKQQFDTKGYENSVGTGKFIVTANSEGDFNDNFLGLGKGLSVEHFLYTDLRFGLPEKIEEFRGKGRLFIEPTPIDTCQIKLSGPSNEPPLVLNATVYGFKPPMSAPSDGRLRFSSPPVELITSKGGGQILLRNEENDCHALAHFALHAKLLRWMNTTTIEAEIRRRSVRAWGGKFQRNGAAAPNAFLEVVAALEKLGAHTDLSKLQFSVRDLKCALPELHEAAVLLSDVNLRIEISDESIAAGKFDALMYLACADLRETTIAVVAERPVIKDRSKGAMRILTLGHPVIRDAYLIEKALDEDRHRLQLELTRHADEAGAAYEVLIVQDIMERLKENREKNVA